MREAIPKNTSSYFCCEEQTQVSCTEVNFWSPSKSSVQIATASSENRAELPAKNRWANLKSQEHPAKQMTISCAALPCSKLPTASRNSFDVIFKPSTSFLRTSKKHELPFYCKSNFCDPITRVWQSTDRRARSQIPWVDLRMEGASLQILLTSP